MVESGGATGGVPETLQGVVTARLDGLPEDEKLLLHAAAVLGKVFWTDALAALVPGEPWLLDDRLHALERKEFVRRERRSAVEGARQYVFVHALVRDAAYAQMPRAERSRRHRAAAEWILALSPDRSQDRAEMLVHHLLQAIELGEAAGLEVGDLRGPPSTLSSRPEAAPGCSPRPSRRPGSTVTRSRSWVATSRTRSSSSSTAVRWRGTDRLRRRRSWSRLSRCRSPVGIGSRQRWRWSISTRAGGCGARTSTRAPRCKRRSTSSRTHRRASTEPVCSARWAASTGSPAGRSTLSRSTRARLPPPAVSAIGSSRRGSSTTAASRASTSATSPASTTSGSAPDRRGDRIGRRCPLPYQSGLDPGQSGQARGGTDVPPPRPRRGAPSRAAVRAALARKRARPRRLLGG